MGRQLLRDFALFLLIGIAAEALLAAIAPSRPKLLIDATTKTVQPIKAADNGGDGAQACVMPPEGPLLVLPTPPGDVDDQAAPDGNADQPDDVIA